MNATSGRCHSLSRLGLTAVGIGALAGLGGATAAATAGRTRVGVRTRTLATAHHHLWSFAQDGGRIAWIERVNRRHCGLQFKTLSTGRTVTTRLNSADCKTYSSAYSLVLAGRSAAWAEGYRCGNTACSWKVATATAGDRRAEVVYTSGEIGMNCMCGEPVPNSSLAGAGRLLVYSDAQGNVVPIRAGRGFSTTGIVHGLAVGDGLIATVSLVPSDSSPAWSNTVTIHTAAGQPVSKEPGPPALPGYLTAATSAAFAGEVAAVSGALAGGSNEITLFDAQTGTQLAVVPVSGSNGYIYLIGGDSRWIVFRSGATISGLNVLTHQIVHLATPAADAISVSVSGRRVAWAENIHGHHRIRAFDLPS